MKKNTFGKDRDRLISFQKKSMNNNIWKISTKYSNLLMKHLHTNKLDNYCFVIYGQYINELNANNININIHKKVYIQIWLTLINSIKKEKNMKLAIHQLHLTNVKHLNRGL